MRYIKRISIFTFIGLLASIIISGVFLSAKTEALSGAQWRAGRIIDDGIFRNKNAMSVGEIQNFLNNKVPHCDRNGEKMYDHRSRATVGHQSGYPPPWRCLKDYYENVNTKENNLGNKGRPTGSISAAAIIHKYAQQYNINPQVLIVLLQKEQSLITDDWPWPNQFRTATGYGCPDSAPCSSQYYGFSNQVRWAARMFQAISDNDPNWYFAYRPGNRFIQWHPTGSCGGSNVNIENISTTALYNYTPYQPNQAALNNLYGTGDSCSSYGNRNFWRLFNDWFGSTTALPYSGSALGGASYTDSTKTRGNSTKRMMVGEQAYVQVRVRNTGSATWKRENTFLGTHGPRDRASGFNHQWISHNRASRMKETTVAPGDTATFEFWYKAPNVVGTHTERFSVVVEGKGWAPYFGLYLKTTIEPKKYTGKIVNSGSFTNETMQHGMSTTTMNPNTRAFVTVQVKNTGNTTWHRSTARLATLDPRDRSSYFHHGSWQSHNRLASMKQETVHPGEIATFKFWYEAPNRGGSFTEKFGIVHEGITWTPYFGFYLKTQVNTPQYTSKTTNSSSHISPSNMSGKSTLTMNQGERAYVIVNMKNTGTMNWNRDTTRLGTDRPRDRASDFYDPSWLSANRTSVMEQASVRPGEIATFKFWYRAPNTTGNFSEAFSVVVEGKSWTPYAGFHLNTTVQ